jgi:serine-type D-Ala-D-Ala endopeptidase (penicillin-binding protein 7)
MKNNFSKFFFTGVVLGVLVFWIVSNPGVFINGGAQTAAANDANVSDASTTKSGPPIFILPSLSADISSQNQQNEQATATSSSGSTATTAPNVGASEVLIADLQTGASFYSLNAGERWPMASISKLMTAVIATEDLDPTDRVTITPEMTAVDPTEHILNVGDVYTVEDLLHVMLLPSNNVAATALADFYGYSNFTAAMNAQAQAWGMTNTYYDDPSGLSAGNESTPDDLLKLAQNIYKSYPQIFAITREPEATVQNLATNQPVIVKSINNFAGTANFLGGKTGYTDQADGNLLSLFSYDGRPIFIVVMGVDDGVRFDATQELFTWFKANFQ